VAGARRDVFSTCAFQHSGFYDSLCLDQRHEYDLPHFFMAFFCFLESEQPLLLVNKGYIFHQMWNEKQRRLH
jgi:hypothetical protein